MQLKCSGLLLLTTVARSYADSQIYFGQHDTPLAGSDAYIRNATDNLIFTSIASLLQQWPNTRYRNGHTIVKGTIPVGTILYHGRRDKDIPLVPEWTAFNVEHSYLLCFPPECWMLTLSVETELNIVYFDGSSAANSYMGHQDSQDIVLWGQVRRDKMKKERERITELCEWAAQLNLDGIVRMEPGFEVMLCDFTKKTKLVSSVHIMAASRSEPASHVQSPDNLRMRQYLRSQHPDVSHKALLEGDILRTPKSPVQIHPKPSPEQPLPPTWQGPLRDGRSNRIAALQAAGWNNFYPGEERTRLDYTRLISFYDPSYTSLLRAREGVQRSHHRLLNISKEDVQLAMGHLQSALVSDDYRIRAPGADWSAVMRAVTDRYADRLYLLKEALAGASAQNRNASTTASAVRRHLMVMLTPYLVYGALPGVPHEAFGSRNTSWVEPIIFHCETSLTSAIETTSLTRSEQLIKRAVEGVLHRICSYLTEAWADAFSVASITEEAAAALVGLWRSDLDDLMGWLDWPMWDVCRPACPDEMFCYIPTWPWGFMWTEENPDTIDMTPRCIDRENGDIKFHR